MTHSCTHLLLGPTLMAPARKGAQMIPCCILGLLPPSSAHTCTGAVSRTLGPNPKAPCPQHASAACTGSPDSKTASVSGGGLQAWTSSRQFINMPMLIAPCTSACMPAHTTHAASAPSKRTRSTIHRKKRAHSPGYALSSGPCS